MSLHGLLPALPCLWSRAAQGLLGGVFMALLPQEVIRKKQLGQGLSQEELASFFGDYLQGKVTDYQVSALLMAVYFQGMSSAETLALTSLLRDSGTRFTWPEAWHGRVIDKHSSGGIGDKTSLLILPLCLAAGLKVPMIAGRGLGHTGGTLDKLEAIPGMQVFLSAEQANRQMHSLGGFIMGQTPEVTPLDQRLYALRDVTSTVASLPLITASILAKKLAEGLSGLVMDVKFGSGAFMQERDEARALAHSLMQVGLACGLQMRCLLTNMNAPLGSYAGNALEVYECLEIMQGRGEEASDTRELSLALAAHMVQLAEPRQDLTTITQSLEGHLRSGRAFECFAKLVAAQGGDSASLEQTQRYRQALIVKEVRPQAGESGFVARIDSRLLGLAIVQLGGGRRRLDDRIDQQVGLGGMKKVGAWVEKDEPLALIYGNNPEKVEEAQRLVVQAYHLSSTAVAPEALLAEVISSLPH